MVGNAGAYGRSMSDVLVSVHLLDGMTEHVKEPRELDFGYRTSLFKQLPELTVLSATFRLHRGERSALLDEIARDAELRRSKHPLEYASCGSYFKNPPRDLPAARLIEDAGLKGFTQRQGARQREARQLPRRAARRHGRRHRRPGRGGQAPGARAERPRAGRRGAPPRLLAAARLAAVRHPPRYTCRVRRREPACRSRRLSLRRKTIEELPHGLVDRLRREQPEARAEFFRRYAPQVRRILFLQGFCEEVDDAVQEVFIKVYRAKIPAEETFLAWFYRVILNTGRDQGRRRKTRHGLMDKLQQIAPEVSDGRAVRHRPTPRCAGRSPTCRRSSASAWRCASSPTSRWTRSPRPRTSPWARSSPGCTAP